MTTLNRREFDRSMHNIYKLSSYKENAVDD